jgi:hypothetical protein
MVELQCPLCGASHWVIDNDYRGSERLRLPEQSYRQRTYTCSRCRETNDGHKVLRKSPPEFFLAMGRRLGVSSGSTELMDDAEFAYWADIFRREFPDDPRIGNLTRWRPKGSPD